MWLLGMAVIGVILVLPLWAIATIQRHSRALDVLGKRIRELEARLAHHSLEAASVREAIAAPAPERVPFSVPDAPPPTEPPAPASARPAASLEQLVGGVWLQNVGSVLLLVGAFFMILWGYTTGRFGPGVLVASGVIAGLGFIWRGDRMARSVPGFGHALIGVGLGAIYLSLYLGRFTLHALPAAAALPLLAFVSMASVAVGLHYRVQAIAVLGMIGAFVPQLLAGMLPLRGFSMTPAALLGYMALVDLVAFALAARAGWSALDLTALILTAVTWIVADPQVGWGWGVQIGLAALFALLGLAPVPRLAATAGRVGNGALAVIAVAPLCLIASSWPYLAYANARASAGFMVVLAVLYLVAALWVDARRHERDLWRPLSAAATLFLTVALQRGLGTENTPMAWAVEGAVLVELGLAPTRSWLRWLGYAVLLPAGIWLFCVLVPSSGARGVFLDAHAIRDLVVIAAFTWTGFRLGARRELLGRDERNAPEAWGLAATGLLMMWSAVEVHDLARTIEGARLPEPESAGGTPLHQRVYTLSSALISTAWTAQALATFALGWLRGSAFLRWVGMGLLGTTTLKFLSLDLQQVDVFWRFLTAIAVGAVLLAISYVYQRRPRARGPIDPSAP